MDTLKLISRYLENQPSQPPIDLWNPPLSGDIDIVIKSNGDWVHEGAKIERLRLIKLFFSILRCENDGEYYLVTPVEKWRIQVEQAAGIVVDMDVINRASKQQSIVFSTNVDRKILLNKCNKLVVINDKKTAEPLPLLSLPYGLTAKLSRSVFYRLVDIAEQKKNQLQVMSDNQWFVLGELEL